MELPTVFQALGGSEGQDRLRPCPCGANGPGQRCPVDLSVMECSLWRWVVQGGDGEKEVGTSGLLGAQGSACSSAGRGRLPAQASPHGKPRDRKSVV